MTRVAVVAHAGKTLGGGLAELRRELGRHGVGDPFWVEVPKSRKAPKQVRRAVRAGARVVVVWGGDGMVQRCIGELAGSDVAIAIIPAGTANLLSSNLDIPADIAGAVAVALGDARRAIDVGRVNGETFAVMAGAGFDARMIADADGALKERFGRLSYIWTSAHNLRVDPFVARIDVDGARWFDGEATCVLMGNVGRLFGGVQAFADAAPDDGILELGVITAEGAAQWIRTAARAAVGHVDRSPNARTTKAHAVRIRFDRKVLYELDGGEREEVRELRVKVVPAAVQVCVPGSAACTPPARIKMK